MFPGLAPDEAYRLADELDTRLDEELHFAFDDRLGYLTQCPTNLGTGMRASLMLHLPALQERGALQQLANTVAKLGLTIRGLYGEGAGRKGLSISYRIRSVSASPSRLPSRISRASRHKSSARNARRASN